jgi:hypothetical protein
MKAARSRILQYADQSDRLGSPTKRKIDATSQYNLVHYLALKGIEGPFHLSIPSFKSGIVGTGVRDGQRFPSDVLGEIEFVNLVQNDVLERQVFWENHITTKTAIASEVVQFKSRQCELPSRKAEPIRFRETVKIETETAKKANMGARSSQKGFNVSTQCAEIRTGVTRHDTGYSSHCHAIVRMAPTPIHAVRILLSREPTECIYVGYRNLDPDQPFFCFVGVAEVPSHRLFEAITDFCTGMRNLGTME